MAKRIRSSASELIQATFGQLSAGDAAATLGSLQPDSEKGASSSSSANNTESSLHASSSSSHRTNGDVDKRPGHETFRSKQYMTGSQGHVQGDFDDFIAPSKLGLGEDPTLNLPAAGQSQLPSGTADERLEMTGELQHDLNGPKAILIREAQDSDGAEVVKLLSDSSFCLIDDKQDDGFCDEGVSVLSVENGRTRREWDQAKAAHDRLDVSPLDLMPNFAPDAKSVYDRTVSEDGMPRELRVITGSEEGPWYGILDRYHDEVWGNLLPLVQQAREEVKEVEESGKDSVADGPAIRRLEMLLGHLAR